MPKRKDEEEEPEGLRDGGADESDSAGEEDSGDEPSVGSVRKKIGEGPDNLRRRGEWYRRRTGGSTER